MWSNVVRRGGLAGMVAAVMWALSTILNLLTTPQKSSFNSFSDYLMQMVLFAAITGTLITILGLYTLQSESGSYRRLGAAGSLMAFVGYAVVLVVITVSILAGGASLLTVRLAGASAITIGSIILGAVTIRARIVPWWCGVLLIVGFPLGDLSNAVLEGGEGILLGITWGAVGYALLSRSGTVAEQP